MSKQSTIGKRIEKLRVSHASAGTKERIRIEAEIRRLHGLKNPGSILFIDDKTFFAKPRRPGHLYLVDESNGDKVAVNRISHAEFPKRKMKLPSIGSYVQLDTIYTGKSGKPIKIQETKEPTKGSPKPTSEERELIRKKAIRNKKKRDAWLK